MEGERIIVYDLYEKEDYARRMELEMLRDEIESCQEYLN